jgi:hypothetical protein
MDHFDDFAEYQLWTKSAYDAWVASGRSVGQAQRVGSKSTFCLMDTARVQPLPGGPSADGAYVLRTVADPKNRLRESAARSGSARESEFANEGITSFTVQRGRLKLPKR